MFLKKEDFQNHFLIQNNFNNKSILTNLNDLRFNQQNLNNF